MDDSIKYFPTEENFALEEFKAVAEACAQVYFARTTFAWLIWTTLKKSNHCIRYPKREKEIIPHVYSSIIDALKPAIHVTGVKNCLKSIKIIWNSSFTFYTVDVC